MEAEGSIKLSCRNLWKIYGPNPETFFEKAGDVADGVHRLEHPLDSNHIGAIRDASFDIRRNETFVIMGLSGSGKSTLLRCLAGLARPTVGEVRIDGDDLFKMSKRELIEVRRKKMGMVFQHFGLLPHQTVLANVAFPLKVQGFGCVEREERARKMIDLVGLAGRESALPRELSGGQQQRVGIARSIIIDPDVWFLDEPFSALDPLIRRQMQKEFLRLQSGLHKSVVFVTHDFLEAFFLADRLAIMNEGCIEQIGSPYEIVLHPASKAVFDFVQDVPLLNTLVAGEIADPVCTSVESENKVGAATPVEMVLRKLSTAGDPVIVVGDDDKILGQITSYHLVKELGARITEKSNR